MSSNDLPEIDEEFFEEIEKLDFQEKQLKLNDQDFINPKKKKNIKEGLNFTEKEISDQDFNNPLETLDIQQRLNLAENEIFRLKAELKIKEDLIENLFRPVPVEIRHIRRAVIEAQNKPERQKNVVVNFKQLCGDTIDSFINEVIDYCEFNRITSFTPVNQFHWHGKHHAMMVMKFDSRETAIRVLQAATEIQKSAERYRAIVVRQDYSSTELKLISLLWKEANERNNKEGMFVWTVKSFRIVKSDHPGPCINKPLNENF
uniref:RRM domain-containing protein n=1 Tax=Panagrolaimus davidi TaxID=227884 RepID=A0A914PC22_9BILA